MRISNSNRKKVGTMVDNRMNGRVARLLSVAVEAYHDKGIGEGALVATVILSALVEADTEYFESSTFKHHCDLLPDVKHIKIDYISMLEQVRKLYR